MMVRKDSSRSDDQDVNEMFERQGRRLGRKWSRNAAGGLVLLVVILLALRFTPYRDVPRDIIRAAKNLVKSLAPGPSTPKEPNPKYW